MKYLFPLTAMILLLVCGFSCTQNEKADLNTDAKTEKVKTKATSSSQSTKPEKEEIVESLSSQESVELNKATTKLKNLDNVDQDQLKKNSVQAAEKRKNVLEKQIDSSPLASMNCQEVLEKYQSVVKQYIDTKDEKVLLDLDEWTNDPIFNSCRKNADFKKSFDKVDEELIMADM